MPANVQKGVYEICDSDLKTPAGIYTSGGVTLTYTQPATGPASPPYTASAPASSNCRTYQSTDLYPSLPTVTSGSAASASQTGQASGTASAGSATSTTNAAPALGISSVAGILGTLFAVAFLS